MFPHPRRALLFVSLALVQLARSLVPGTYVITNVQFPDQRVVGPDGTTEGAALGTFNLGGQPVNSNHVWTVDSGLTTLQCQLEGVFAMTDATFTASGGTIGQGVFTVAAPNPQPPLIKIGQQQWEFIQGSRGVIIALSGQDLAWSLATNAVFTQVTMQPIDTSDLRQQWVFTSNPLAPPP